MPLNFNKQAQKGNQFLHALAEELGDKTDTKRAGRMLRLVFNALRNHLTVEENLHLVAQLPETLKSVYVHGWAPYKKNKGIEKKIDLVTEVMSFEGLDSWKDFPTTEDAHDAVIAVLNSLKKYISQGEFEDIEAVLPKQIKDLLRESIYA